MKRSPNWWICAVFAACVLPLSAVRPQDNWFHDVTWDKSEAGPGQLVEPYGVAIGPDGRIFVGDDGADKIVIYNPDGTFNGEIAGTFGDGDTFSQPRGMITDASGKLYVADLARDAVFVFNSDGSFASKIGGVAGNGDGELDGPIDVAIGPGGEVYVVEYLNERVSVFNYAGAFLRKLGGSGLLDGQFKKPISIAVSRDGHVYVCQYILSSIWFESFMKEFDENGLFVRKVNTHMIRGTPWQDHSPLFCGSSVRLDAGGYLHVLVAHYATFSTEGVTKDTSPVIDIYDRDLERYYRYGPRVRIQTGVNEGQTSFPSQSIGPDGTLVFCAKEQRKLHFFRNAYREMPIPARNGIPIPGVRGVAQRSNSPFVDIDYEVVDTDDAVVTTGMLLFKDGNQALSDCIRVLTLAEGTEARLGAGIATNTVHRVTWNAGADWSTELSDFKVAVLAKDNRANLVDIHYLLLPADHGMPELKISRSPLIESDFMQIWWWLLATQDSGISLNAGQIHGVGGAADGLLFIDNDCTTADGRDYLYGKLNVREATAAELQWAKEAATKGIIEVWEPARTVGGRPTEGGEGGFGMLEGRPRAVNEYGFDTGDWGADAWWVVPLN